MTLRTRLLITFIALGAVPLMVVGWVTSQRTLRAVEDLVARETRVTLLDGFIGTMNCGRPPSDLRASRSQV